MIDTILSIVNKFIPDKDQAAKAAMEIEKEATKRMEIQSDIIKAEIANGSGKWRVKLMYLCMLMVTAHFLMYDVIPYMRTVFNWNFWIPEAPANENLWEFLQIGVVGYISSRGIEKTMGHFRRK